MRESKMFLWDFITPKKIKNYVLYLIVFAVLTGILFEDKEIFHINSFACSTIGIGIAFTSTAYVIYTYSIFENIKLYLTLPISKWKLFGAYFAALWVCTIIQRISFVIVVLVNYGSNILENSILLIVNSGVAVLINIGILLGKNGKRKVIVFKNTILLILLFLFGGMNLHFGYKLVLVFFIGVGGIVTWRKSVVTDLIITHEPKNKLLAQKGIRNYFLKVVFAEKIYIVNTICIVAFMLVLCLISRENPILFQLVWCIGAINTPFVTMISSDVWVARHIDMLPEKQNNIYWQYGRFLCGYFLAVNMIIIGAKSMVSEFVTPDVFFALFLAILETISAVFIEKKYRITGWQTKQELWKNPRKYVLPLIVFVVVSIYYAII